MRPDDSIFRNLELTDDDISVEDDVVSVSEYNDVSALNRHLCSTYQWTVIISSMHIYNLFYGEHLIWEVSMPGLLDRLDYLFRVYGIEYEYVLIDGTNGKDVMNLFDIGNFSVLTGYTEGEFFQIGATRAVYVMLYCNFPEFSYKESYYFMDRLQNTIWRTADSMFFSVMNILHKPYDIYDSNSPCAGYMLQPGISCRNRNSRINDNLPFKTFFMNAITCFRNSTEDKMNARLMLDSIYMNIPNPFDVVSDSKDC